MILTRGLLLLFVALLVNARGGGGHGGHGDGNNDNDNDNSGSHSGFSGSTDSTGSSTTSSSGAEPTGSSNTTDLSSGSSNTTSGATNTGGYATYFTQNNQAGACGQVHSDSDFICAMDQQRYGDSGAVSSLCGKKVLIKNTNNGKTVTVTVADDCPTCENENSIDLSVGAFTQIATEEEGMVPIEWSYVD